MQVYQPKDRLDMEIEELRMLMMKMSQRRHEERMNIYINKENRQSSIKIEKKIVEARLVEHCNRKLGNQEN